MGYRVSYQKPKMKVSKSRTCSTNVNLHPQIIHDFDTVYSQINSEFPIPKPYFYIVDIQTSQHGSFYKANEARPDWDYKYAKGKDVLKLNLNSGPSGRQLTPKEIHDTIVHEFVHSIIAHNFPSQWEGPNKHDVLFWSLCKDFGLGPDSYHLLTKPMKEVWPDAIPTPEQAKQHQDFFGD